MVYVGWTGRSPFERLKEHNTNSNHWTSKNGPFKLIYYEKYICEADARAREKFYKVGFGRNIKSVISEYVCRNNIKIISINGA